jgi:MiaB-like tRNA modifying enzyme
MVGRKRRFYDLLYKVTKDSNPKRVYIETFGCSFNQADSQIMKGILHNSKFQIVSELQLADVVIINSCYVKLPTQNRIIHRLQIIQKQFPDKKIIVAGCMVEIDPHTLEKIAPTSSWVGPHQIKRISDVVSRTLKGKVIRLVGKRKEIKLTLPKIRDNPLIDIVQICEGCEGVCSYCCTRFARKRLFSYPINLIKKGVEHATKNGCKEIWITAQDTGIYGRDIGTNLAELLNKICKIDEKFFVRVGMMNPMHVKDIVDELIESYRSEKIFKFLHLPVQSGSSRILKLMNRGYTVNDFRRIVKKFRKEFPFLTLSTDVIVGFPGEEEKDFQKTVKLIREVKPDIVNVSKFGARPGTKAAEMEQLPRSVIDDRTKRLVRMIDKIKLANNKKWLNWEGEVLIDEKGKKGGMVGRNFAYKPVLTEGRLGTFKRVKIIGIKPTFLVGK